MGQQLKVLGPIRVRAASDRSLVQVNHSSSLRVCSCEDPVRGGTFRWKHGPCNIAMRRLGCSIARGSAGVRTGECSYSVCSIPAYQSMPTHARACSELVSACSELVSVRCTHTTRPHHPPKHNTLPMQSPPKVRVADLLLRHSATVPHRLGCRQSLTRDTRSALHLVPAAPRACSSD